MMREIKFRVWDTKYSCYAKERDFELLELNWPTGPYFDRTIWIDDENRFAFEQYTGLKDKNGKESYHHDKVQRHKDEPVFVIEWDKVNGKWYLKDPTDKHRWQYLPFVEVCEIIGNIHEPQNPKQSVQPNVSVGNK